MEYTVSKGFKRTSKALGRPCLRCNQLFLDGDLIVSKKHRKYYHKACFEAMFIE